MNATPGETIYPSVNWGVTGVATLRVRIIKDSTGATSSTTTTGITEAPASSGIYIVTGGITAPTSAGEYTIVWDDQTGSGVSASDDLLVTYSQASVGAPSGTDLCTVADIHTHLSLDTTTYDDLIQARITELTRVLRDRYGRDFAPVASTARTLGVYGYVVDLSPYDLNTASAVSLHPESSSPVTLTADTDYALEPIGTDQRLGTYYRMILAPTLNIWSTSLIRFGAARVQITGTWGPTSVPDDVRYAAILTVATSIDRSVAAYSIQSPDVISSEPDRFQTWAVPAAAHSILSGYTRRTT